MQFKYFLIIRTLPSKEMFQAIKGTYFTLLCVLIACEKFGEVSVRRAKDDYNSWLRGAGQTPTQWGEQKDLGSLSNVLWQVQIWHGAEYRAQHVICVFNDTPFSPTQGLTHSCIVAAFVSYKWFCCPQGFFMIVFLFQRLKGICTSSYVLIKSETF